MKFNSVNEYLEKLNNIFHLLVALPLLGFVAIYLQMHAGEFDPMVQASSLATALRYSFPFLVILTGGLAFISYRRNLITSKNQHTLREKLIHYFRASLVKFAFLGAASVVAVTGLFLTTENLYVVLYIIVLMLLSINRPTVFRIARDLGLRDSEKDIVIHKKEIGAQVGFGST